MLLAIDIGNSAVKGAVFDGSIIRLDFRIAHTDLAEAPILRRLLNGEEGVSVDRIAISSVVPAVAKTLVTLLSSLTSTPAFWISHDCRLPFRLGYERPHQLGVDRIAAAVGAYRLAIDGGFSRSMPIVAVDGGTAVTFNIVDATRTFRGGPIWAGPDLVLRALGNATAQLPAVEARMSLDPFAPDTATALQSGAMLGFIEGTRGILDRIVSAIGTDPFVLSTGGRGGILAEEIDLIARNEPHLVLRGVREIAEMNPERPIPS